MTSYAEAVRRRIEIFWHPMSSIQYMEKQRIRRIQDSLEE